MRRVRIAAGGCAFLLAVALLQAGPAGGQESFELGSRCQSPTNVAERYRTDASSLRDDGTIVFGGQRVRVAGPDAEFLRSDADRGTWNLWFRSWSWLAVVARSVDPTVAVDIAVAWHEAVPDIGASAPAELRRARGWNEGAVTQRMNTVTCLWTTTRDERLRPVIEALVEANLDEKRYYGRPRLAPHNHGAMANFALIAAADEFGRPDWADAAMSRFAADFPEVFAACGADREQSASYLLHNRSLWLRAARVIEQHGEAALASRILARVGVLEDGVRALTEPDGMLPTIGDGYLVEGLSATGEGDLHWWCPERGWAAGRDSWRSPGVHYTARFGPEQNAHGHDDHGSLTWWVGVGGGTRVLVDRGNPEKDTPPSKQAWADSKAAHNTFAAKGRDYRAGTSGTRELTRSAVTITTKESAGSRGLSRKRTAVIDLRDPELTVTDTGLSRSPVTWVQSWQLDPAWIRARATRDGATARHSNGATLRITCDLIAGEPGAKVRARVITVPHYGLRGAPAVDAPTVTCEVSGRSATLKTSLVVTG